MKKILSFALVLAGAFLFAPGLRAQNFITITGTVQDPNGIPYGNGTMSAVLVPGSPGGWRLGGQPYSGRVGPVTLDSAGKFTANFGNNSVILPAGTQWLITVNSNQGGIAPPLGTGAQTFSVTMTLNSSQDISTTLNAAAPKLTNITVGSGSVTSVSGTSPIVATPNPITGTGSISCPTCVTASGGGSINVATNQVAFGTGANALGGSNNFEFVSGTGKFLLQDTALGLTQVATAAIGGTGSGTAYGSEPAFLENISNTNSMFAEVFANSGATGNTGSTRNTFLGIAASNSSATPPNVVSMNYISGGAIVNQITFGGTGPFVGQGGALEFGGNGNIDLLSNNDDSTNTDFRIIPDGGFKVFADNAPFELACQGTGGCPPLQFDGSSSGSAQIGAAAAAGTPNKMNLPTSTGSAGQFLSTDGGNPQQLSWTAASACATCVTSAAALTNNSVVLGAGGQGSKTVTAFTTNGTSTLTVGVAGGGNGTLALAGNTSGTATLTAPAVAGTSTNPVVATNVWSSPLGGAATPTYSFTGHLGDGLYWSAASAIPTMTQAGADDLGFFKGAIVPNNAAFGYQFGSLSTGVATSAFSTDLNNLGLIDVSNGTLGSDTGGILASAVFERAPATGTNTAGNNYTARAGLSTGNATPGVLFQDGGEISATSGTTVQTAVHRQTVNDTKVLSTTNTTATAILSLNVAADSEAGAIVRYTVIAKDTTGHANCVSSGLVTAVAENSAGTIKSAVNAATGVGNANVCTGADTIALSFTITAANPAVLSVTPTWVTIVPTNVYIIYNYDDLSDASITP